MTTTKSRGRGSRVRVGVRVRPLASKEIKQGGTCTLDIKSPSIRMGRRRFEYDAVFDSNFSQTDLYENVSAPLLSSFVDGYNATIMAYGQTGSGKTFTMGSEAHVEPEESSQAGLIPRFITDFFLEMQRKKAASDEGIESGQILLDYNLKASFLEVYGEDVYDLLDASRNSLPLRENSKGGIVVAGLTSRVISNTAEALGVLHEGTMNRTTAATLMNHTSSRSHAVFTIHLSQVTRRNAGDSSDVVTTSQFTFVDLAGSERMKKTGAEGERAREGIKINEGLLALGNVINALADEEKVKNTKKVYVPYRQSKLTRLLQDALGGNSQTFFLACVSPSDTNASETLSTLNYANRARNIRNAPTKNVDQASAALQQLQNINHVLQLELVKSRFQHNTGLRGRDEIGVIDESLLKREDVEAYMKQIYDTATAMVSPRNTPHSFEFSSHDLVASEIRILSKRENNVEMPSATLNSATSANQSDKFDHSILEEINPDEEMAILDHLLELQQHDQEYENSKKQDDMKLKEMDGELEKQESLLLQLRDSLQKYHGLKGKYEELMEEVQQLEKEKSKLAKQLDRVKSDPTKGCSASIKKKLERVEINLSRARREKRYAEDQEKKCKVLERKVSELKQAKLVLKKKQKEDAAQYRKATEAKTKELLSLKRKARTTDKRMSKLENELSIQKKYLSRRTQFCTKLTDKLKKTESHLVKLLALRQNDRANQKARINTNTSQKGHGGIISGSFLENLSKEEMKTTKYVLDRMVSEKVKQARLKKKYQDLAASYGETMRKVVLEMKRRNHAKQSKSETVDEIEDNIVDLELKLELLDAEMQEISVQLPKDTSLAARDTDDAVTKVVDGLSSSALKNILYETFSRFVDAEIDRDNMTEALEQKNAAVIGLESEVDTLDFKVRTMSKDLVDRIHLDESKNDHFLVIKELTEDKEKEKSKAKSALDNLDQANKRIRELESSLASAQAEIAKTKDKLAIAKASMKKSDENVEVIETVSKLHRIWEELGADDSTRENAQRKIEFSLENVCADLLKDATESKHKAEKEIGKVTCRLKMMEAAMGVPHECKTNIPKSDSLLSTLEFLRGELCKLEIPYRFAAARRRKIVEAVKGMKEILGISTSDLHDDLKALLSHGFAKATTTETEADENQPLVKAVEENCLEKDFLARCESHVSQLRLAKSEKLVRNRELQQWITEMMRDMHITEIQSLEIIESWMKSSTTSHPQWWNLKVTTDILENLARTNFVSCSKKSFSQHLEFIGKVLSISADHRRSISSTLTSTIEQAQKTLLDIVGREIDASEAYAGFHSALLQMPPLSKDLISSCINELESLIHGIEAMTQSETEALNVVWDALKVTDKERNHFWVTTEECVSMDQSDRSNLPNFCCVTTPHEKWMKEAVSTAKSVCNTLDHRMKKLEIINKEVEKLRSKQDIKSQILSLDSEIRIMNTKLLEFEELKCTKQRLLTKKNVGTVLLKQERFRKQMQTKFSASLKRLVALLQSWEKKEHVLFDDSLLSDDVRELLRKDPEKMENWVEMRTKLMPLRTTKTNGAKKRPFPEQHSSRRTALKPAPAKNKTVPNIFHESLGDRSVERPREKGKTNDNGTSVFRKRDMNSNLEDDFNHPKKKKRRHDTVALPFGSILADTPKKRRHNNM